MTPGIRAPRIPLFDALRGLAIIAMVAYHFAWDLFFLGFTATDVINEPGWAAFQRAIVTSFLLLVGMGLTLAHAEGIRWRPFWRRFALILGGALLVTLGTYLVFPDYFVFFGILHAIALFSLLGLPFVRAPLFVVALAIPAIMLPPAFVTDPAMMARPLSWIGFWPIPPMTTDIVPVFPWFGVVLIGILATRLLRASRLWPALARPRLDGPLGRALRWLGRWSLVIYLVHQPLLYGGLSLLAPGTPDEIGFLRECEATCRANGGEPGYCARYCGCALEETRSQSLWAEIAATPPTLAVAAMTAMCSARASDAGVERSIAVSPG